MSEIKVSSVEGNTQLLDGGAMFGNAPRAVWERWVAPDLKGRIPLACRSLLVDINGIKILCETGIGSFFEPKLADRFGVQTPERHLLSENLNQLGVSEDDIDFVILSHLHFDHAGGLMPSYKELQKGDKGLRLKKAKYVVGMEAFQRSAQPHPRDRASFIGDLNERLKTSERLIIVNKNEKSHSALPAEVSFIYSDGHTPGQMLTKIKGSKYKMIFTGDLVPGTHWVHLPITMGYDRFAEKVIDEKRSLYEDIENTFLFYTHDDKYCASRVQKNEAGKFEPIDLKTQLIDYRL